MESKNSEHLSSKEVMKKLKVSSCELMHLRVEGKLKFIKKRNSYLYNIDDVKNKSN